ncbi:MAG: class I SAM-dependent RNA methyltransferase [Deltaproteobacteria bacterium]|nr:class I SAM-dependent RNA methyltransferase [Candidatus Anaeroferrophillus wilburensis]MBN2889644.1 class I SAM-dependent RNA methyltransferase [Deltaproteobacteria bacterium]
MSIFSQASTIHIPCAKGIPPFLKAELQSLGFPIVSETVAGVSTKGTLSDAMRLNLCCRTGQRIFFQVGSFTVGSQEELFSHLARISWEKYLRPDRYLTVTSVVDHPSIRDSRFANQKTKDVIVDRLRRQYGRRPDSGPGRHGAVVHLFWKQKTCLVYLDTSGESLARRGYRQEGSRAPLQETLAAAVVQAAWNGMGNFINPMCGSGTLVIEAALQALQIPPGLDRENFAFMHLAGFSRDAWQRLCRQARSQLQEGIAGRLIATDHDPAVINIARRNAQRAGVEPFIEFSVCDFAATTIPPGAGVVILNPEYGERLGSLAELPATYKRIGDYFKQHCAGYRGFILTGNLDLAKKVGLKARRRYPLFNGAIECRLLEYELYAGSRP